MTGFGKATKEFENKTVNVEIRSLNSKNMDLSLRISNVYREYELELRNEITKLLAKDLYKILEKINWSTMGISAKEFYIDLLLNYD